MNFPHEAHRSSVYLNFKEIGDREFQLIVRFYEEYERDIQLLTLEENFEMSLAYIAALFEVGAYTSYLSTCDEVIESVIHFNIDTYKGEKIYEKLLFRKAASHYHLMEYQKSEKILRELIRINPDNQLSIAFLKKCLRAQPPEIVKKAKITSVLLFLLTAFIIAIELFIIKKIFPEYGEGTELLRNIIFGIGWLTLLGGLAYLHYTASKNVNQDLERIRIRNRK